MKKRSSPFLRFILVLMVLFVAVGLILVAYRLISGRPLGIRAFIDLRVYQVTNSVKMVANSSHVTEDSQGNFTNIIFLHHSVGNHLVSQGKLRELLQTEGFEFWDHGRNDQGLRDPEGKGMGYNYNVPNDNTDPDGLVEIFRQKILPLPLNTLSSLLQHEVIILKSCYAPANNLRSDALVEMYKVYYQEMRDVMAAHPDHIFVLLTTPPLNPAATTAEEAARARQLATWLSSAEFLGDTKNVFVFNFFDLLAESDPAAADYNMLRAEYRDGEDSHPNQAANEAVAPLLASFLADRIQGYRAEVNAQ